MNTTRVAKEVSRNKYSDEGIVTYAQSIKNALTDNENFPGPNPQLTELQKCIDEMKVAIVNSKNGNKEDTAIKRNKRANLEAIMKKLANYVQDTSNGDEAIILSSGFEIIRKASPVGPLPRVTGIEITPGTSRGSLNLKWDVVESAYAYNVEYIEMPGSETSSKTRLSTSKSSIIIPNLKRGQQYAFQVVAVGSDPTQNWSDEVSSFVM
ncbi:fibronectin type III domain-containing protein [Microbacter margulisiae]|uniref:Fibronectin type-III domain-containing protein n=1 Tax=Microbacter margulisiae TaxID=1350067 RepID=A0A7W5H1C9_9PORP|nr:fibronectin type III domain-containing protein [Microbacter margulisiae]MBB3186227.1 hypothetical protein [Microbacter margulisiae]